MAASEQMPTNYPVSIEKFSCKFLNFREIRSFAYIELLNVRFAAKCYTFNNSYPIYAKLHHQFIMASENSVSLTSYRPRRSYFLPSNGTPSRYGNSSPCTVCWRCCCKHNEITRCAFILKRGFYRHFDATRVTRKYRSSGYFLSPLLFLSLSFSLSCAFPTFFYNLHSNISSYQSLLPRLQSC